MAKKSKPREKIVAFGYPLDETGRPLRQQVRHLDGADYGADPLPDGTFRMVPSGDIVPLEERNRRLSAVVTRWVRG